MTVHIDLSVPAAFIVKTTKFEEILRMKDPCGHIDIEVEALRKLQFFHELQAHYSISKPVITAVLTKREFTAILVLFFGGGGSLIRGGAYLFFRLFRGAHIREGCLFQRGR